MTILLRDPVWQFIGALIALIALVVAIIAVWIQRRKKELSYRVLTSTQLLTDNEELKGKVKIIVDETLVEQVHLLELQIENTGNVPIAREDFEVPLTFTFGENAQIFAPDISEHHPDTAPKPNITYTEKQVSLEKQLLNAGDSLTIKLLLAQYDGSTINAFAHVSGVREVKRATTKEKRSSAFYRFMIAFTIIFMIPFIVFADMLLDLGGLFGVPTRGLSKFLAGVWLMFFVAVMISDTISEKWGSLKKRSKSR